MVGTLTELDALHAIAQDDGKATYAKKIDKAESRIDWSQDAEQLERQVRAFAPAPGAWFEHEGERYRVLRAELAEGPARPAPCSTTSSLSLAARARSARMTIQRAGKPAMDTAALLRGKPIPAGTVLS